MIVQQNSVLNNFERVKFHVGTGDVWGGILLHGPLIGQKLHTHLSNDVEQNLRLSPSTQPLSHHEPYGLNTHDSLSH